MKRKLIIRVLMTLMPLSGMAQASIDSVLVQIETNNTTLAALRKTADAEKIGSHTGIYLQNPEVGFNYLWVDPASTGNRTDFNVRQSFDFPTSYGYKKQISGLRNSQADLEYRNRRLDILLNARMIYIDIVYLNALIDAYEDRFDHAEELKEVYDKMYATGQTGILERNKVILNLLNTQKELESLRIRRAAKLEEMATLNGGLPVTVAATSMPASSLPPDFDGWYQRVGQTNPTLLWMEQEVEASQYREKLNRALSLPRTSAGYMSENRTGEHFQGVTLGISIPLFEHKNTVKYAQVSTMAWESNLADYRLQLYHQLRIQYDKAFGLGESLKDYRLSIDLYQNTDLLKKALDHGEISLINYLTELSLTYSIMDNYFLAENEYNIAVAELYRYVE